MIDSPASETVADGRMASWVEVDAVQLEAGDEPGPYRPGDAVGYAAVPDSVPPDGCLVPGFALAFDCALRNNTSRTLTVEVTWRLLDVLGLPARARTILLELDQGGQRLAKLDFGPAMVGYYVLESELRFASDGASTRRTCVPVPSRAETVSAVANPFFGLAGESASSGPMAPRKSGVVVSSGVTGPASLRVVEWRWRDIETAPGSDDFAAADRVIGTILADGGRPVVGLAGPAPGAAPVWVVQTDHTGLRRVDGRQYRQFVFRTVSRFRGRVHHWLLPVAPRSELVTWSQIYRQGAKLADPNALVVGPGFIASGRSQSAEIQSFIAEGGGAEVDVLVHSLLRSMADEADGPWESPEGPLAEVRQACVEAGLGDLPRWELTTSWLVGDGDDLADRAIRFHRAALLLARHDVAHWIIPHSCLSDAARREAFSVEAVACAALTRRLRRARFEREEAIAPGVIASVFDAPEGPFAVLVRRDLDPKVQPIWIHVAAGLQVENVFGRVVADGVSSIKLPMTTAPLYVIGVGERANWLGGVTVLVEPERPDRF
jgi:hypothetical protein